MQGPSKVIVVDPDPRAGRQVQLGFEREGISVVVSPDAGDLAKLELGPDSALALVGGVDGRAIELVRRTRQLLQEGNVDVPIVSTGRGVSRAELEAAGADEVVVGPTYLRDLVTIARVMRGAPADHRDHFVGSLVETTGVYTLVRALAALGRSAVLTLIRGLRRGEVRFHHGEVTSAQVGLIHGQAAFHQLLLWTDARFDFSHEDVVRRQQIPLAPDELFADAERFLDGVRASAEKLSPSMVLEQNVQRIHDLGNQVPTEVHGVLRMFDGHRMLADILEDSPYRVFETLRVSQKAMEAGLLQPVEAARPKATWRAVLAIEEWLVGSETRDAVVERTAKLDSGPIATGAGASKKSSRKKRKKRRANTPPAVPIVKADIDWGALVPRVIGTEVGPLSGVVPAMDAHGEIDEASRDKAREGLEALMDTGKRDRIFPKEVGLEPSVVIRGEDTDEWERIESEAKAKIKAETEAKAKQEAEARAKQEADAKLAAETKAKQEADAKLAKQEADAKLAADANAKQDADITLAADPTAKPDAEREAQRFREEAQGRVRESVERMRVDRVLKEQAEAHAQEQAARGGAADEARAYAARVKAQADAKREAADQATREADERARQQADRAREAGDRAAAQMIATPSSAVIAVPTAAALTAAPDVVSPKRERKRGTDAKSLVKELVAEAVPAAAADRGSTRELSVAPITVAETPTATVTVADTMTVVGVADTVTLTSTPTVTVREPIAVKSAAPSVTEDDPSDGIVRAMIATADTAQLAARAQRRLPSAPPVIEGPILKDTTGEIRQPAARAIDPVDQEPSVLVSDLAAAHVAISTAIAAPRTRGAAAVGCRDVVARARRLRGPPRCRRVHGARGSLLQERAVAADHRSGAAHRIVRRSRRGLPAAGNSGTVCSAATNSVTRSPPSRARRRKNARARPTRVRRRRARCSCAGARRGRSDQTAARSAGTARHTRPRSRRASGTRRAARSSAACP